MFDKVQESLKRSKDEHQKQFARKSGFNRRRKRYRLKKNAFSPLMTKG